MYVEKRPTGLQIRRGSQDHARPANVRPQIHLCIPDLSGDEKSLAAGLRSKSPQQSAPPRDPIDAARAKLSEKRYREGHQHVTDMIEELREKRRRLFKRLWAGSIALTALSVVALAVELIHRAEFLNPLSDTVQTDDQPATSPSRRTHGGVARRPALKKTPVPRQWSNALPTETPVQSAVYETTGRAGQEGAWLDGKIAETDTETDRSRPGAPHDDSQSGPR